MREREVEEGGGRDKRREREEEEAKQENGELRKHSLCGGEEQIKEWREGERERKKKSI